jgi:hypothetical protein
MFRYGMGPALSSRPRNLTAPNGLNFSRSLHNPISRLNKVRDYLATRGEATKVDILHDVFGKTVGRRAGEVTYGWGTYLFGYGIRHGFFKKVRKGNRVYWSNT